MLPLILACGLVSQALVHDTLQPRTYASPSGAWSLRVDPGSRFADGPSRMRVAHQGETAWESTVPFTFWEALITDEGFAAGFAYSEGIRNQGELVVAILAADGKLLLEQRTARGREGICPVSFPPEPRFLLAHPELDRLVLVVRGEDSREELWPYRLSSGEVLPRWHPGEHDGSLGIWRWTTEAKPVPGTPLTIVRREGYRSTAFVLLDSDWQPVWTLNGREGGSSGERDAQVRILATDQPGRFDLHHAAAGMRVSYDVRPDPRMPAGWRVKEGPRAPLDARNVEREPPLVALRKVASVPLDPGPVSDGHLLRNIRAFVVGPDDGIGFVRENADEAFTLVAVDASGDVMEEHQLELPPTGHMEAAGWFALPGGQWLHTRIPRMGEARSRAWWIEADGRVEEIRGFEGPRVESARSMPDGGFVVAGSYQRRYTSTPTLIRFDASGRRVWELADDRTVRNNVSVAARDIAVEESGRILLLQSDQVLPVSAGGEIEGAIRLVLPGEMPYLTELRVEPLGTWLVHHSDEGAWYRLDRKGNPLATLLPRRESGSTRIRSSSMLVDARGHLWGTDGDEIFVLDEEGVARTRFGAGPDPQALVRPRRVAFDGRGRVAVADGRTHAVHLFSSTGARELVLQPAPTDFDAYPRIGVHAVRATPDGTFFLQPSAYDDDFLAFSPAGMRLEWTALGGERIAFAGASGDRWASSCPKEGPALLRKIDASGAERLRIERAPDGKFMLGVHSLASRSDGAVAVLHSPRGTGFFQGPELDLALFSPAGVPERVIALHDPQEGSWEQLSYGSRWILAGGHGNQALLVSLPGGEVSLVRVDEGEEGTLHAFALSPDERELWCATLRPLALHRFALPE